MPEGNSIIRVAPGFTRTLEDKPRGLPSCKHGVKLRQGVMSKPDAEIQ